MVKQLKKNKQDTGDGQVNVQPKGKAKKTIKHKDKEDKQIICPVQGCNRVFRRTNYLTKH